MKKMIRFFQRSYAWAITFTILVVLATLYVLLDAFVIPRKYVVLSDTDVESSVVSAEEETKEKQVISTNDFYSDGNVTIQISTQRIEDTTVYVADITLSDPNSLRTAFAENTYGKNITAKTSAIAKENDAILAINGDFYGVRDGYVIRNGILYRDEAAADSQEDLVIRSDGSFSVIKEGEVTAQELLEQGSSQVFSFGPALVVDGTVSVTEDQEVDRAMATNPRTAIGIIDELHYVMAVADGRTRESKGLSLYNFATFLSEEWDVQLAYNLDGGGSSTLYFQGNIINKPTSNGHKIAERSVSDIVYLR